MLASCIAHRKCHDSLRNRTAPQKEDQIGQTVEEKEETRRGAEEAQARKQRQRQDLRLRLESGNNTSGQYVKRSSIFSRRNQAPMRGDQTVASRVGQTGGGPCRDNDGQRRGGGTL